MVVVVAHGEAEDVGDLTEILEGGAVSVELEGHMTLLHVMSVGCLAIYHVTTSVRHLSHRVVGMAPLKVVNQDPGNEAQEGKDEDGKFALEA